VTLEVIHITFIIFTRSFAGKEDLYKVWWWFGLPLFIALYAGNRIIVYTWLWKSYFISVGFFFATLPNMLSYMKAS